MKHGELELRDLPEEKKEEINSTIKRLGHLLIPGDYSPDRFEQPIEWERGEFIRNGYAVLYVLEHQGLIDLEEVNTSFDQLSKERNSTQDSPKPS